MKKFTAVLSVCVLICLLLCSCGADSYALDIGGARVDADIYAYFLDRSVAENADMSFEEQKALAKNMCAEYVAVNTKYNQLGLSVTAQRKSSVSNDVNALWRLYYNYYESIGVSKQTLVKIYESQAYKMTLLLAYYDTDGITPVAEDRIKAHFSDNYVVFKSINDYLTKADGNGGYVALEGEELTAKQTVFKTLADKVSDTVTLDSVYSEYTTSQGQTAGEMSTVVISKDATNYPSGFFDRVKAIAENDADAVTLGNYIFCVQHLNAFVEDGNYYNAYREDCLISLVENDFEKLVDDWAKQLEIKENAITVKKVDSKIEKARAEKAQPSEQSGSDGQTENQ